MTLIVNLLGGPGTGKSTTAAGIFYKLKSSGVNCEYIQEFAKDKTWEENAFTLGCQPYITAKQLYRQHRVIDKVDVAITDAPLLNGLVYPGQYTGDKFDDWLIETFKSFNNLNIFLQRNLDKHPYNPSGRSQSLDESLEIDIKVKSILDSNDIPYRVVSVSDEAPEEIIKMINLCLTS